MILGLLLLYFCLCCASDSTRYETAPWTTVVGLDIYDFHACACAFFYDSFVWRLAFTGRHRERRSSLGLWMVGDWLLSIGFAGTNEAPKKTYITRFLT
jgi:hypothetical protein